MATDKAYDAKDRYDVRNRYYVAFRPDDELAQALWDDTCGLVDKMGLVRDHIVKMKDQLPGAASEVPLLEVLDIATLRCMPAPSAARAAGKRAPASIVTALAIDPETCKLFEQLAAAKLHGFLGFGTDLPIDAADHWCPVVPGDPVFGRRTMADTLIGASALREQGLNGEGVNVVIFDRGLDPDRLLNYGGLIGEPMQTGAIAPNSHGMMVARNIEKLAPQAKIFDCPILPPRINDLDRFLSYASAAYDQALDQVALQRAARWVFVNAWAVFDLSAEEASGAYSDSPDHFINAQISDVVSQDIDVVFAAGNCGQFSTDARCGEGDMGPGHSVFGANALPAVLTVGSVRADATWIGYSSQGPGPSTLAVQKPDLCAPSQFCEDNDSSLINSGSSAACGVAAGVVAALRSDPQVAKLTADQLRTILISTARQTEGEGWSNRLGHGILNAQKALAAARAAAGDEAAPQA